MSEDVVERVAKALFRSMGFSAEFDELEEYGQELWRSKARAAIEAMMEPTPGMLEDAGPMEGFDCYAWEKDVDRPHIEWWKAMIRAALMAARSEPIQ